MAAYMLLGSMGACGVLVCVMAYMCLQIPRKKFDPEEYSEMMVELVRAAVTKEFFNHNKEYHNEPSNPV